MSYGVPLENRVVSIPITDLEAATRALWRLGVSVRSTPDQLKALIRLGHHGSSDRAAVYQVELRLAGTRAEQVQWLNMCLMLPCAIESLPV